MFGDEAKPTALRDLTRYERDDQVPVMIETIDRLPNRAESVAERRHQINQEAVKRDRAWA